MNEDNRRHIANYLDEYGDFVRVCKEHNDTSDLSSMELAILHHGYATGGKQNA